MSNNESNVNTKVETVDVNIDEIFGAAPTGADMVTDEKPARPNIFGPVKPQADMSFTEPEESEPVTETDEPVVEESTEEVQEEVQEEVVKTSTDATATKEASDLLDSIDAEETTETRGRKRISGITDVFQKLIKDDKIIPFDDDKALEDYSAKDWQELIQANLDEKANAVRRETPRQFFESLPRELQAAAKYVADGGTDMRGLFSTLAAVEETRSYDPSSKSGQEAIIREYLGATGYGTPEEVQEEIETWKDLGKLEQQAKKFKPKLDKMQEKIVQQKLKQQEAKKIQKENASKQYMNNVYAALKEGSVGDIKIDKRTQSMLFNGLVQPAYPSINGSNTNLLGHLLEKYQFVEPNYQLISEALWLLQDPGGYKAKIMEKGSQAAVEKTVRKLKTEQSVKTSGERATEQSETSSRRKLPRKQNIFKRF